jgi:hypothetical protein
MPAAKPAAGAVRGPDHRGFLPDVLGIVMAIVVSTAIFAIGPPELGFLQVGRAQRDRRRNLATRQSRSSARSATATTCRPQWPGSSWTWC